MVSLTTRTIKNSYKSKSLKEARSPVGISQKQPGIIAAGIDEFIANARMNQ